MKAGRVVFAIPGDIATPSGGYGYDRRLIAELVALGWQVDHLALPGGFPTPDEGDLESTREAFAKIDDGCVVLVDGLAFGAMPQIAAAESERLRLVALVHHPLCLETGLDADARARLELSEREALRWSRAVVVTSKATGETLASDFGVPDKQLTVAPPGTDKPARSDRGVARRSGHEAGNEGANGGPMILSIGTLIARKDHATLVAGLAHVSDLDWCCRIVGSKTADPQTVEALERQIAELGLDGRVVLVGALADVSADYDTADLFVLASRYEGYGMVFAEAMAHGLPIIFCSEGAPRELIPPAAGERFSPGDARDLGARLRMLLTDRDRRAGAARASFEAGRALPGWDDTAFIVATTLAALEEVA